MFCTSCGIPAQPDQRFCAGCGAALEAAPAAPAVPPAVAAAVAPPAAPPQAPPFTERGPMTVSVQGVDANWNANGSYDAIELGVVSVERLLELARYFMPQSVPDLDDPCPIGIIVEGPLDQHTFMACDGEIQDCDTNRILTPEQMIAVIHGG